MGLGGGHRIAFLGEGMGAGRLLGWKGRQVVLKEKAEGEKGLTIREGV